MQPPPSDPVTLAIEAQRRRIRELEEELQAAERRGASQSELWRLERLLERERYFGD